MSKELKTAPTDKEILKFRNRLKGVMLVLSILPIIIFPFVLKENHNHWHTPWAYIDLNAIAQLQALVIKQDYYGIGKNVYANPSDGRGISDLYEIGYDGSNSIPNNMKGLLHYTFANADDSNPAPVSLRGYFFRDLKCKDYSKQYAVMMYPEVYGHRDKSFLGIKYGVKKAGTHIFIMNESSAVYMIDARELYPDIKTGDAIPITMTEYPKDLSKWTEAGK